MNHFASLSQEIVSITTTHVKSESKEELYDTTDEFIDKDKQDMEGLTFFIGRNNDTIWANKRLSKTSKVRSKYINKTILSP
ncbi:hypothetical protein QTP88_019158 [Uroleucon formosanum]